MGNTTMSYRQNQDRASYRLLGGGKGGLFFLQQMELRCAVWLEDPGSRPEITWPLLSQPFPAPAVPPPRRANHERKTSMDKQVKLETVEMSELTLVSGGIWDYSNRLGILGEMLEADQNAKYDDLINPKTLDAAASLALKGWVSLP